MESAASPADVLGLVGATIEQVRFDAVVDGGGFGLVYRGRHVGIGEDVAIKVLRIAARERATDELRESLAARFRDETKILYRLSQGSLDIVRCIGGGAVTAPTTRELVPYMVLEWLEGRTLSAELRERRERGLGPRSLEEAERLLRPAASGLAYAHAHDVVHRDVKPQNLFLVASREGVRLKILDFGLAKILSDESLGVRPSAETQAGVHLCSPAYGAPEQFSRRAGEMGPWTDVYALTLVLLELLTGARVRPASTLAEGLLKALDPKTGSPRPSDLGLALPEEIDELLARGLAQDPRARPADVSVLWSSLRAAMDRAGAAAIAATHPPEGAPFSRGSGDGASGATQPDAFAGTMLMPDAPQPLPAPTSGPRPSASALPLFQGPIVLSRAPSLPARESAGSPLAATLAHAPLPASPASLAQPASLARPAGTPATSAPAPHAPSTTAPIGPELAIRSPLATSGALPPRTAPQPSTTAPIAPELVSTAPLGQRSPLAGPRPSPLAASTNMPPLASRAQAPSPFPVLNQDPRSTGPVAPSPPPRLEATTSAPPPRTSPSGPPVSAPSQPRGALFVVAFVVITLVLAAVYVLVLRGRH